MEYRNKIIGPYTDQPTVYRLNIGPTRYYIWKAKSIKHSVSTTATDIDRFLRKGVPADHKLKNVIDYIKRARPSVLEAIPLLQTDNVKELLDFEKTELQKCMDDPNCLNVTFEAHIPKWIEESLAGNSPINASEFYKGGDAANGATHRLKEPTILEPSASKNTPEKARVNPVIKKIAIEPKNASVGKSAMMLALEKIAAEKNADPAPGKSTRSGRKNK